VSTLNRVWQGATPLGQHLAIITENKVRPDFIAALVVSRQPLDEVDEAHLREVATGRIAYLPSGAGDSVDVVRAALQYRDSPSTATERLAKASRGLPYAPASLEPTNDDRPFFNLHRPWSSVSLKDMEKVLSSGKRSRARLEDMPVAQVAVILLLLEVLLVGAIFVVPPYRSLKRQRADGLGATAVYFAALGFAFIVVEVGLIQRLTQLIGDPGWSLVAVLAVLLSSTAVGSEWLVSRRKISPRLAGALAAVAAVAVAFVVPAVVEGVAGFGFMARLGLTAAIVFPIGLCLGTPFAAGLAQLHNDSAIAWAWSLNSLLSVTGSISALILGSSIGFSRTALLAAAVYACAAAVGPSLARVGESESRLDSRSPVR
jgi:hypothetical protein